MIEQIKSRLSMPTMIWAISLILIAGFSFFFISKFVATPEFSASTVASLDEKKSTVMKLAAAAAASSTALSAIPGDATTPIANQIAGLTSYFIIILAALLLEKMLIAVVGHVAFSYLIPVACGLGIVKRRGRFFLLSGVKVSGRFHKSTKAVRTVPGAFLES